MVVIVMGTTGAGKTTIGTLLAARLGWTFADGDDFHPASNVAKMSAGVPLDDADRAPWLLAMSKAIAVWLQSGTNAVLACSALRRAYRDELRVGTGVTFVYLKGSYEEIAQRLRERHGHFAGVQLLASQFETLEKPEGEKDVLVVPLDRLPDAQVDLIVQGLGLEPHS
ncbi:MAG TPA: gluconokinase [Dehalococcoidia bacterium]|nr:gluconokinase [Dehalococcoidia bacterium]